MSLEQMNVSPTWRLSIDVGGTFTDLLCADPSGSLQAYKVLTTPKDPSIGVFVGLRRIADDLNKSMSSFLATLGMIMHSTTITTNSLITGDCAKVGLLVTRGFRDALEMRRGYKEKIYDTKYLPPKPPVPRHLRREVTERIGWDGEELIELDVGDIEKSLRYFHTEQVQSVAICFLHSYRNSIHEKEARKVVEALEPKLSLSVSNEIVPEAKFYERTVTTVYNAAVAKLLTDYLDKLEKDLRNEGFGGSLLIVQSNAGMMSPQAAKKKPCLTISSGPGAGAIAAASIGVTSGWKNCIGIDMGGTTCIVTIVRNGRPLLTTESEFNLQHLLIPMIEAHTIGAGGGSIAWVDTGGMLRVGPYSAASDPGPACYGKGGEDPTVTDADLMLGYISPNQFWGGNLHLDQEKAEEAIASRVAVKMGLGVQDTAVGIFRIVNTNMSAAVREASAKKGLDPRKHVIILGGGAGPLHGCAILEELEIPAAIMPRESGAYTALGMLMSDLKHDFVSSYHKPLEASDAVEIKSLFAKMQDDGRSLLVSEGVSNQQIWFEISLDLRYIGQFHEINVAVQPEHLRDGFSLVRESFHNKHDEFFGYSVLEDPLEILNLRCTAHGTIPAINFRKFQWRSSINSDAKKSDRKIFLNSLNEFDDVPVFDCKKLGYGNIIEGPAIIEHPHTELVVDSPFSAGVQTYGDLILYRKERAHEFAPKEPC